MTDPDTKKRAAAEAALGLVENGMRVGLGTGSTASAFIRLLGPKVRAGLRIVGVPTSEATRRLAEAEGIPLVDLADDEQELDITIDGADEIDPALRLIKGAGGALMREKIVATASRRMVVIADESKVVPTLGAFPLPVEVSPFAIGATRAAIARAAEACGSPGPIALRERDGRPFLTDGGHVILDLAAGVIRNPDALAVALDRIPGVLCHGLFIGLAKEAIIGQDNGVRLSFAPGGL